MRIGIDIDNTMTNSRELANKFYRNYEFKESGNCYTEMPEKNRRKFLDIYLFDIMKNAVLKDNVKEVFEYLKNNNHQIIIITRRGFEEPKLVEDITLEYFKKNDLHYDEIYFSCENKGKIAKSQNIDLFVDDHLFNLDSVALQGIKCLLFGFRENNIKYDFVLTWMELLDYIKKEGF